MAYDRGLILKDSGVRACEKLAAGDQTADGQPAGQKLTEARYREMRAVFEDSRHDDIRDHGTKLMDVVWQITQTTGSKAEEGTATLAFIGPLTEHVSGLQSACADQGITVTIKMGPDTQASAAPDPAPSCDLLFPPTDVITAPADTVECQDGDVAMMVTAMKCTDGRTLFQLTPAGRFDAEAYGFSGGRLRKTVGDPMNDETYSKASQDCFS